MHFTKMNGAGNDFILLDAIAEPFDKRPPRPSPGRCVTAAGRSVRTV